MNSRNNSLERVALGIASMFGCYWLYLYFLQEHLNIGYVAKKMIGLICLYGLGLVIFLCILKKVPTKKYVKRKISTNNLYFYIRHGVVIFNGKNRGYPVGDCNAWVV